jgi:hypothetical protein
VKITLLGERRRGAKVLGALARGVRRISMQAPMRGDGDGGQIAPPMPASATPQEDDLDEMLQQIELDQQPGRNGLPWSDSADGACAAPLRAV